MFVFKINKGLLTYQVCLFWVYCAIPNFFRCTDIPPKVTTAEYQPTKCFQIKKKIF